MKSWSLKYVKYCKSGCWLCRLPLLESGLPLQVFVNGAGGGVGGGPGGLEVETAGDGVYVKDFTGKVKAGEAAGFEGVWVDFFKAYATAGDEFFFKTGAAVNLVRV